jgi:hypothetical protein
MQIPERLKEAVEKYFTDHEYRGNGFYKLYEIRDSSLFPKDTGHLWAVPAYLNGEIIDTEDLSQLDEEWLSGLADVGCEFNVGLTIPYWCFQK